jgi:hypothetical protein
MRPIPRCETDEPTPSGAFVSLKSLALGCAVFAVAFGTSGVEAAGIYWNNPAGGLWSDPLNWTPSAVPGPADDVSITLKGQYSVTIDATPVTIHSLAIGGGTET